MLLKGGSVDVIGRVEKAHVRYNWNVYINESLQLVNSAQSEFKLFKVDFCWLNRSTPELDDNRRIFLVLSTVFSGWTKLYQNYFLVKLYVRYNKAAHFFKTE